MLLSLFDVNGETKRLFPEHPLQRSGQQIHRLVNGRGEVLIHHLLRLCPVLDTERAAQHFNVGQVFFGPARHELAGQDICQVAWYVEVQLVVGFEQAHRRKLILTQLK